MKTTSGELLEFDTFKLLLRGFIASPLGRAALERARPITDRATLEEVHSDNTEALEYERALRQTQRSARGSAVRIHFGELSDCHEATAKLAIEGAVLDGLEILEIVSLLAKAIEVKVTLAAAASSYPRLGARGARIEDFRPLLRDLSGKINPDGSLADDASVALKRLRRDVERQRRRIQESLERFLRAHREEGVLQEEFVTIRNERFVVPIVSGQQRRVDGVVHGASGTGHTLFVEPLETIALNNELVSLSEEAMAEEHRLLREFSDRLRTAGAEIQAAAAVIGELEFLFAKARYALDFGATVPRFSPPENRCLVLRDARHPLLEDVLRKQRKPVIPISLELDSRDNTLLISGPNTGGKTVTLKTVGLLALAAQAGFPVTAAEAEFPIFEEVLADIGDNQSIQESLSTFSAHIARIREIIDNVTPDSLVLLDELGRATDPEEGGALGAALLDEFRIAGAITLASTHLMPLKVYGANTEGVVNGSVGFDDKTLEPTYHLRTGAPGKSAGLDIAGRLGLPPDLIERARRRMSSSDRDIADFLNRLHERLEAVTALESELEERNRDFAERQQNLAGEWKRRETKRLAEIERRIEGTVSNFEARAEETIQRIVDDGQQRKAAEHARRKVARARREFREELESSLQGPETAGQQRGKVVEGAMVRLRGVRQTGRVKRFINDDVIEIEAGYLKLQISVDDVIEVLPQTEEKPRLPKNVTLKAGPKAYLTTQEVNVIGRRAEEAVAEVDKFLDSAAVNSVDRVRIIHGHGMGVLKKAVAELLDGHPHVHKFYSATPAEGGTGATIAELND